MQHVMLEQQTTEDVFILKLVTPDGGIFFLTAEPIYIPCSQNKQD